MTALVAKTTSALATPKPASARLPEVDLLQVSKVLDKTVHTTSMHILFIESEVIKNSMLYTFSTISMLDQDRLNIGLKAKMLAFRGLLKGQMTIFVSDEIINTKFPKASFLICDGEEAYKVCNLKLTRLNNVDYNAKAQEFSMKYLDEQLKKEHPEALG